ncbi:5-methyltetrahydropteroyltriglutamate--homocysteine S-methyltransferase, partial [Nitrospira sp. BLG_2]
MAILATCLGYPRIGGARELKKAVESYWATKSTAIDLHRTAADLRRRHWSAMKQAGIDHIPVGDFSLYDHMLDMAVTVGAVPKRYQGIQDPLIRYFAMARGLQSPEQGVDVAALEMTKWFDTNYHYIVPELEAGQTFKLEASQLLAQIDEARSLGIGPRPVIPGPVTFLLLSKMAGDATGMSPLDLLEALLPVYEQLITELAKRRVGWIQL